MILPLIFSLSASVYAQQVAQHAFMAIADQQTDLSDLKQDQWRLLSDAEGVAQYANPEEWLQAGKKFVDLTDHLDLAEDSQEIQKVVNDKFEVPKVVRHESAVNALLADNAVSIERMTERLTTLSSFNDRYYRSKSGVQSSEWVESQIASVIVETSAAATVSRFRHSWPQFSLIARLDNVQSTNGTAQSKPDASEIPVVIMSAHYDGVKGWFGEHMPAADDDGSGAVTLLEAFTILCQAQQQGLLHLQYPIEFHWYSAEEVGLKGSQDIAAAYQRERRPVVAVLHHDMTGFRGKSDAIGMITDNVSKELTHFLKLIMQSYTDRKVVESRCGYGCSDHASWTKAGYRSALQFEGLFNEQSPYIHSQRDTIEHIDFEHMSSFAEVAVAFACEIAMVIE